MDAGVELSTQYAIHRMLAMDPAARPDAPLVHRLLLGEEPVPADFVPPPAGAGAGKDGRQSSLFPPIGSGKASASGKEPGGGGDRIARRNTATTVTSMFSGTMSGLFHSASNNEVNFEVGDDVVEALQSHKPPAMPMLNRNMSKRFVNSTRLMVDDHMKTLSAMVASTLDRVKGVIPRSFIAGPRSVDAIQVRVGPPGNASMPLSWLTSRRANPLSLWTRGRCL